MIKRHNCNIRDSERLRGKPFWIWNSNKHKQEDIRTDGDCCFNHIIGLPEKNNEQKTIYDYEKTISDFLVNNKNIWIKRATGLGITEFRCTEKIK